MIAKRAWPMVALALCLLSVGAWSVLGKLHLDEQAGFAYTTMRVVSSPDAPVVTPAPAPDPQAIPSPLTLADELPTPHSALRPAAVHGCASPPRAPPV